MLISSAHLKVFVPWKHFCFLKVSPLGTWRKQEKEDEKTSSYFCFWFLEYLFWNQFSKLNRIWMSSWLLNSVELFWKIVLKTRKSEKRTKQTHLSLFLILILILMLMILIWYIKGSSVSGYIVKTWNKTSKVNKL